MAFTSKKNNSIGIKKRNKVINSDELDDAFIYKDGKKDLKNALKILDFELTIGEEDINKILRQMGNFNMSFDEVSVLTKIPKTQLKKMLDKGKEDLENKVDSEERTMYINYAYGRMMLEGSTVMEMMKKSPDKLLSKLNPEKYSENISEKYEIPQIIINVSDRKEVDLEEIERKVKQDIANIK